MRKKLKLRLRRFQLVYCQQHFVLIEKSSAKTVADAGLKAGASKGFVEEMDEIYIYTKLTLPKEKTSITFTAPPGNIYDFICTYPGHYARMKGVFIVE